MTLNITSVKSNSYLTAYEIESERSSGSHLFPHFSDELSYLGYFTFFAATCPMFSTIFLEMLPSFTLMTKELDEGLDYRSVGLRYIELLGMTSFYPLFTIENLK